MKILSLVVPACISLAASQALANQSFKAEVDFVNPNGCRVFDMVVDPNCDYDLTPNQCHSTQNIIKAVALQIPNLELKADCSRLHTGNFFARLLDELMMNSTSFDGYKLKLKATEARNTSAQANVQTTDASSCADAASAFNALATQGLRLSAVCDANELRVQYSN